LVLVNNEADENVFEGVKDKLVWKQTELKEALHLNVGQNVPKVPKTKEELLYKN